MRKLIFLLLLSSQILKGFAQTCHLLINDSVEIQSESNDIFFSPSGKGFSVGDFSSGYITYLVLNDSKHWQIDTLDTSLRNVHAGMFITNETGFLVGGGYYGSGLIWTTTNEGDSWSSKNYSDYGLYGIDFLNSSLGYVVGNGGVDWDTLTSNTTKKLLDVDIVNDSVVYISGDKIVLKSVDAGQNWTDITPLNLDDFTAIDFYNNDTGIVISYNGTINLSTDGGLTWTYKSKNALGTSFLCDVYMVNSNHYYACGGDDIIESIDGGATWYKLAGVTDLTGGFTSISYVNSDSAYFAKSSGSIIKLYIGTNTAPTDLNLSDTSIFESAFQNRYIGTLSSSDKNISSYKLKQHNDYSSFVISNDSLFSKTTFDYTGREVNVKTIFITAQDQCGLEFEKKFQIRILPFGPNAISISNNTILENMPIGTFVGKLASTSPETNQFEYLLVNGELDTHNSSFTISNDSIFTNEVFTKSSNNNRYFRVSSTDTLGNTYEDWFWVKIVSKSDQTITFNALPIKNLNDSTFELTATASSGLKVSYTSSNENVATISGSTVTIVGAGITTITASQEGNANYHAAISVERPLEVRIVASVPDDRAATIFVYPNPANEHLTIRSTNPIDRVLVFDVTGRQVVVPKMVILQNRLQLDVRQLRTGSYLYQMITSDKKYYRGQFTRR